MSVRTARCVHRVLWFADCPWCETDRTEAEYTAKWKGRIPFWRKMDAYDVLGYLSAEMAASRRRMIEQRHRALPIKWFDCVTAPRCRCGCPTLSPDGVCYDCNLPLEP